MSVNHAALKELKEGTSIVTLKWLGAPTLVRLERTAPKIEVKKNDTFECTKEKAIALRKQGYSLKELSEKLNIAKSTASNWSKDVNLPKIRVK